MLMLLEKIREKKSFACLSDFILSGDFFDADFPSGIAEKFDDGQPWLDPMERLSAV